MAKGITGMQQLKKQLSALPEKVQKKIYRQAMRPAMKIIHKEIIDNTVPVDTGMLKDSLKVRAAKRSKQYVGVDIVTEAKDFTKTKDGAETETPYYSAFLELGTKHIEARGYMRRAVDNKGEEALDVATDKIAKLIEKEAAK